ncbi:MAG: tRNA epoxyqueuosine(34) reductase QueG [Candidatus Sumerlaeia bacterium]
MNAVGAQELREAIRQAALGLGFSRVGFTGADPLPEAQQRRWERWFAQDKAGVMGWLARRQPRRTHPRDLMPEAQTAIVVAAGYRDGDHPEPPPEAIGKIARYAWGRDYHAVLREKLDDLAARISEAAGEDVRHLACVDSKPIDERGLAARAGLGFIGKNTLLIDPAGGSWAVLGVLLVNLALPPDEPARSAATSCGSCRRCLEACPTGAITGPYALDPRRCISYLTIETRGDIPPELAANMQGWAFGCDICQEVCPFNAQPLARAFPDLAASAGAGPYVTKAMLGDSGKGFLRKFGHTPLARTGLKGLRRFDKFLDV